MLLFDLQIEDGEIFATINQRDGMVRFHDNPEKYNSARMLVKLDHEVGNYIGSWNQGWIQRGFTG